MSSPDSRDELLQSLVIDREDHQESAKQFDDLGRKRGRLSAGRAVAVTLSVVAVTLAGAAGIAFSLNGSPQEGHTGTVTDQAGQQGDAVPPTIPAPAFDQPSRIDAGDDVGSVLNASGYVIARRAATVSSKTTGKVEAVLVEEGMQVVAGQVLARLDSRIESAQLALGEAQVEAAAALSAELDAEIERLRTELIRWRALAAKGLASESQLDELDAGLDTLLSRQLRAEKEVVVAERRVEMQRVRVDDQTIRAPFAGTVVKKSAQPGEMISPVSAGGGFTRTGICTIVDMTSLEVEVDVNESYINRVYASQSVTIRLTAYPDRAYPGEVLAVIPTADRSKATIRVRLRFLEADEQVLPNMGLQVAFLERERASS